MINDKSFIVSSIVKNEKNQGYIEEPTYYGLIDENKLNVVYSCIDFNTEKGKFEFKQESVFYSPLKNKK